MLLLLQVVAISTTQLAGSTPAGAQTPARDRVLVLAPTVVLGSGSGGGGGCCTAAATTKSSPRADTPTAANLPRSTTKPAAKTSAAAAASSADPSLEELAATAVGLQADVVDEATWAAMTTADFAKYRAIVLGDPNSTGLGPEAAATANAATWGAAVNGNTLIVGTDPVYHAFGGQTGANNLINHGVAFATSEPDKTGLYLNLSCYYHGTAAHTPVPLLDALRPGGFSVTGVGCFNDAHIVARHPALDGLSDADLSNWSCSVHEAFDTWPADFTPLAIARDFDSSFTASDGSQGPPYILATGAASFPLSVTPLNGSASPGGSHTVTGKLLSVNDASPVPDYPISFKVSAGPNAGAAGTCTPSTCKTRSDGTVDWTYPSGGGTGTDTIIVWLDFNTNGAPDVGEPQVTAAFTWKSSDRRIAFVPGIGASGTSIRQGRFPYGHFVQDLANRYGDTNVVVVNNYQGSGDQDSSGCHSPDPDTSALIPLALNSKWDNTLNNPKVCDSNGPLALSATQLDDDLNNPVRFPSSAPIFVGFELDGRRSGPRLAGAGPHPPR